MKTLIGLFFAFLLFASTTCRADVLVLSHGLKLEYPAPTLISHTGQSLIFKYADWSLVHEVVNPATIYAKVDLTGIESLFIKSIFDEKERDKLPAWLASLSSEQAKELGVTGRTTGKKTVGEAELLSVFDENRASGHIYLFEGSRIHHFVVQGQKGAFKSIIDNIKER